MDSCCRHVAWVAGLAVAVISVGGLDIAEKVSYDPHKDELEMKYRPITVRLNHVAVDP